MRVQVRTSHSEYKLRRLLCIVDKRRDVDAIMAMPKHKVLAALVKKKEVIDCITQYAEKRIKESK